MACLNQWFLHPDNQSTRFEAIWIQLHEWPLLISLIESLLVWMVIGGHRGGHHARCGSRDRPDERAAGKGKGVAQLRDADVRPRELPIAPPGKRA